MDVLPKLVDEYIGLADEIADLEARRAKLRELLLPLVEQAGGSVIDEHRGVRLTIRRSPRWEWDATRLKRLVDDHLITGDEFAAALLTVVDKEAVKGWVDKGLITDRQLATADAKLVTKVVESLVQERIRRARR